jgi:hypothetical protein
MHLSMTLLLAILELTIINHMQIFSGSLMLSDLR